MDLSMIDQDTQTLQIAKACAYQMSRMTDTVIEVRQVTAQGFIYCESGATNEGQLVGCFRRGETTY
jgi:hypothetical protein